MQDAYANAFAAIRDGRFDEAASVETWLYRIVVNVCLDALRRRKTERRAVESGAFAPPAPGEPRQTAFVALQELAALLDVLPDEQRAVLVLKVLEGRSVPEIAAMLRTSAGAVEQKLVRARATLREKMNEPG